MLEKSVNEKFTLKNTFIDSREKIVFQELDSAEKNTVISKNNDYGRIVCRCETVTEGEIRAAAQSPISPVSVVEILADELNKSPLDILQDREGSYILVEATKGGH